MMKQTVFSLSCIAAAASALVVAQQPPPAAPPPQQQEFRVVINGPPGLPPKLGIADFVALSSDAETVAAAKTIGDVLYDDINYEREYYMIAKDAVATIPKPTSLDSVPLDRWKELNANAVVSPVSWRFVCSRVRRAPRSDSSPGWNTRTTSWTGGSLASRRATPSRMAM